MTFERIQAAGDLAESTAVIRNAFSTVAKEFGLTRENAATNPAFIEAGDLIKLLERGVSCFGVYEGGKQVGFVAVEKADHDAYYMEKLAVVPECRHQGYGRKMMDFVFDWVRERQGRKVSIGIIDENHVLKAWYRAYGFTETGTRIFPHLPFTVCFLEKPV